MLEGFCGVAEFLPLEKDRLIEESARATRGVKDGGFGIPFQTFLHDRCCQPVRGVVFAQVVPVLRINQLFVEAFQHVFGKFAQIVRSQLQQKPSAHDESLGPSRVARHPSEEVFFEKIVNTALAEVAAI
jgi:hypothetical protein